MKLSAQDAELAMTGRKPLLSASPAWHCGSTTPWVFDPAQMEQELQQMRIGLVALWAVSFAEKFFESECAALLQLAHSEWQLLDANGRPTEAVYKAQALTQSKNATRTETLAKLESLVVLQRFQLYMPLTDSLEIELAADSPDPFRHAVLNKGLASRLFKAEMVSVCCSYLQARGRLEKLYDLELKVQNTRYRGPEQQDPFWFDAWIDGRPYPELNGALSATIKDRIHRRDVISMSGAVSSFVMSFGPRGCYIK